jgi:hypothetical protein
MRNVKCSNEKWLLILQPYGEGDSQFPGLIAVSLYGQDILELDPASWQFIHQGNHFQFMSAGSLVILPQGTHLEIVFVIVQFQNPKVPVSGVQDGKHPLAFLAFGPSLKSLLEGYGIGPGLQLGPDPDINRQLHHLFLWMIGVKGDEASVVLPVSGFADHLQLVLV